MDSCRATGKLCLMEAWPAQNPPQSVQAPSQIKKKKRHQISFPSIFLCLITKGMQTSSLEKESRVTRKYARWERPLPPHPCRAPPVWLSVAARGERVHSDGQPHGSHCPGSPCPVRVSDRRPRGTQIGRGGLSCYETCSLQEKVILARNTLRWKHPFGMSQGHVFDPWAR